MLPQILLYKFTFSFTIFTVHVNSVYSMSISNELAYSVLITNVTNLERELLLEFEGVAAVSEPQDAA